MAGRDALMPFLRSAPDLRLVECYEKFFEGDVEDEPINELPYPQLEEAVKNDLPVGLIRNKPDFVPVFALLFLKNPGKLGQCF